ncbi:MAG: hypothetical protein Kow0042_19390 [Calditrichia bacterium]
MSLRNKKILICRRAEQAREMVLELQKRKAWPIVFPTFRVEPIDLTGENRRKLENLQDYDWLILGSENGARFFFYLIQILKTPLDMVNRVPLAVVGRKTAARYREIFPNTPVQRQADSLQQLIEDIAYESEGRPVRILNPTSIQSLENIQVEVAPHMILDRVPIYQTLPLDSHDPKEIEFVKSGKYDAVFFGSPSAFDYFVKLVGSESLQKGAAICASGSTTASHIEKNGFPVKIIPSKPQTAHTVRALEQYFQSVGN